MQWQQSSNMVGAAHDLLAKDPAGENQRHEDKTCIRNSQQLIQHTHNSAKLTRAMAGSSWGFLWCQSIAFHSYLIWHACVCKIQMQFMKQIHAFETLAVLNCANSSMVFRASFPVSSSPTLGQFDLPCKRFGVGLPYAIIHHVAT